MRQRGEPRLQLGGSRVRLRLIGRTPVSGEPQLRYKLLVQLRFALRLAATAALTRTLAFCIIAFFT